MHPSSLLIGCVEAQNEVVYHDANQGESHLGKQEGIIAHTAVRPSFLLFTLLIPVNDSILTSACIE
jgi:hypothetical protein